jgi:hypothetical protein
MALPKANPNKEFYFIDQRAFYFASHKISFSSGVFGSRL